MGWVGSFPTRTRRVPKVTDIQLNRVGWSNKHENEHLDLPQYSIGLPIAGAAIARDRGGSCARGVVEAEDCEEVALEGVARGHSERAHRRLVGVSQFGLSLWALLENSTKFGSSKYRHTGGCAAPAATRHINRSFNFECSLLLCTIFATIILLASVDSGPYS
ncbi:hypothetical protein B0H13DRAFT_1856610 [Mycena leptocephala]|nr:hypothetical protein B0H13DRAFT_1856610 [Mycena leptocephala]